MRKIAFLLSSALLLSSVYAFSQDQAPAPIFKDGDFWRFKVTEDIANVTSTKELDGIYELVYSQGRVKAFLLTGDQKGEVELEPVGRHGTLLILLGLNPKRPNLKFPLSVGQKRNYEETFSPMASRARQRLRTVEVRVVGIERVTTQAGTFRAFKIIEETIRSSGGKGPKVPIEARHSTSTHFYSAESKSIVKSSGESSTGSKREIELVKVGSKSETP